MGIKTKMGCQGSRNNNVDKRLGNLRNMVNRKIKLLLLGAGESGKTTFAKQVRLVNLANDFTDEMKSTFLPIIQNNVLVSVICLIEACEEWGYEIQGEAVDAKDNIMAIDSIEMFNEGVPDTFQHDVEVLWDNESIQQAYERRSELQFIDAVGTYFIPKRLEKICDNQRVPSINDIMYARSKTTGISELSFTVNNKEFLLVDVGGQRTERKKWIHCFDEVNGILFMIGISEYDQYLYEDDSVNRMHEADKLFRDIITSPFFEDTGVILFLNKYDLFQDKIKKVDMNICYEDYQGGCNEDAAKNFLQNHYKQLASETKRELFQHFTCATDVDTIQALWKDIQKMLVLDALGNIGIV
eukprot:TRINITY_DN5281_c0_g1_i1.p1 TRINITY_DN5281_c0_g1~~TRINITY_DN5281_c0_g1_i1.p1  ORF type:complete len:355 (+),score=66.84 TRINITY_DN5281_c0_g1_i1:22-1086(+)